MLDSPNRAHLPPSPWTDDLTGALKALWADGLSASYIAGELGSGLTRNAVISKVHRLGLPARRSARARNKARADKDRSATMRIKKLRVRGPSHGGTVVVESVVREEAPQPQDFLSITFADLAKGQCKFPRGEGAGITFCGQPQMSGQPYCRNCCAIAFTYTPPPVKRPYYATGGSKPAVF